MDSKADNSKSKQQIKNIILYATVAVLVSSAFLAIFMIFFGDIETILQVFCTLAIIYVITILTTANLPRLGSPAMIKRVFALASMIFNLFWGIPWVLIIWGCFADYNVARVVWQVVWTFLATSVFCLMMAMQLPISKVWTGLKKVQQSIPVTLSFYLYINVIVYVWTESTSILTGELLAKLIGSELILLLLQWAVPAILLHGNKPSSDPAKDNAKNNPADSTKKAL